MPISQDATKVFDREFLGVRAKLLEIAATLDRLDRAGGGLADDRRMRQIREAIETLLSDRDNRAEEIQLIFSLAYDDTWQEQFFGA